MDRVTIHRLGDDAVYKRISTTVREYLQLGTNNVEYWSGEWDYAHDMLMAYASLTKNDFENLDKGHPRRFILPMTATQLTTMGTFISQVLFGDDQPHKVTGRGPEDEVPAEHLNTLLRWNAEQQPTYSLGYLWVMDCLTYNRGIMYNSWAPIFKPKREYVAVEIPGEVDDEGNPETFFQMQTRQENVGGFCKHELVSPYDWFCDPSLPLHRFQEGRFAGHRFRISYDELCRRSKLSTDDPAFVLPESVAKIKEKKRPSSPLPSISTGVGVAATRANGELSRSAYERQRIAGPLTTERANKNDTGTIECVELWVKLVPADYGFYDGYDPCLYQIVIANGECVLSVNEVPYDHGEFPYAVAEGRPSGHYQFSPSWAFMLKGLQDHIDYLKNRHQEALQRTVGNVFIVDPEHVDVEDFLDPDREGQIIPLKPGGNIRDSIQQIPIKDLTEGFAGEAQMFMNYSESVTGANSYMQGSGGDAGSATEFAGTQQMAAGRMSSIARLISVQGVVPQTRQFVTLFQQFLEDSQIVRYNYDPMSSPEPMANERSLEISLDTIQGTFDFVASDGTLPTGDAKKVAAITGLLQSSAAFPQVFAPAPGNLDPKALILAGAKAAGLSDLERFKYNESAFNSAVQGQVMSQEGVMPEVPPGQFPPDAQTQPPPIPFNTPGPDPSVLGLSDPAMPTLPNVSPPEVRPQNY